MRSYWEKYKKSEVHGLFGLEILDSYFFPMFFLFVLYFFLLMIPCFPIFSRETYLNLVSLEHCIFNSYLFRKCFVFISYLNYCQHGPAFPLLERLKPRAQNLNPGLDPTGAEPPQAIPKTNHAIERMLKQTIPAPSMPPKPQKATNSSELSNHPASTTQLNP